MVKEATETGLIPDFVPNWIDGKESRAKATGEFPKVNPATGALLCRVARSTEADVNAAVNAARCTQPSWAEETVVQRGDLLRAVALAIREGERDFAEIVSLETGKSRKEALGETSAAIEMGLFIAGEGRRFYGRTTTSAVPHKSAMTIRQPRGVAGLIVAANTPIANVAWKAFPALLCGNSAVLKAAEDTPATAWAFAKVVHEVGIPKGVFNAIQGYGEEAGAPLVAHPDVNIVSFTGSTEVGRIIQRKAGERLAKVCLELGGKNPFVVCDDADLELAAKWAILSAFSNAGQRCSSGSRIIIFDAIYEKFREKLIEETKRLRVGPTDDDDLGPVINEEALKNMLAAVESTRAGKAKILVGGYRLTDPEHRNGFYMAPTLIEGIDPSHEVSRIELFGPIACLYRVKDFGEALALANDSPYALTAAIHTRSLHRAQRFTEKVQTGVVSVNGGTYGSEPHIPFGGLKASGTGSREAGTEVLDVYSDWKTVYVNHDPTAV